MKPIKENLIYSVAITLTVVALAVPQTLPAQQSWKATVGAQSPDMGKQAVAFLPNEIWVRQGDTIDWTFASDDIHTVAFLTAGQPVPPFFIGCPGFSPSGAIFDGTTCVTSPPFVKGQTFSVIFSAAGNYKLVCLVHPHMTGLIHVLPPSAVLPHDQAFYDQQAAAQSKALLNDTDGKSGSNRMGTMGSMSSMHPSDSLGTEETATAMRSMLSVRVLSGMNAVTAGTGEVSTSPGGFQSLSVVRFLNGTISVNAGDTVEWSSSDPANPHTITFGDVPQNVVAPSANVFADPDGALHAVMTSHPMSVHSGFLVQPTEDQPGLPVNGPTVTRFRVTFTQPGTYPYRCALHDNPGMVGKVIVH